MGIDQGVRVMATDPDSPDDLATETVLDDLATATVLDFPDDPAMETVLVAPGFPIVPGDPVTATTSATGGTTDRTAPSDLAGGRAGRDRRTTTTGITIIGIRTPTTGGAGRRTTS